jgi:hypothetical protein
MAEADPFDSPHIQRDNRGQKSRLQHSRLYRAKRGQSPQKVAKMRAKPRQARVNNTPKRQFLQEHTGINLVSEPDVVSLHHLRRLKAEYEIEPAIPAMIAAEILNVSRRTIYRWIDCGLLVRVPRGRWGRVTIRSVLERYKALHVNK